MALIQSEASAHLRRALEAVTDASSYVILVVALLFWWELSVGKLKRFNEIATVVAGLIAVAGLTAIFLGKSPALLLPINSALAVCVVLVLLTVSAFPSLSGMPSSSRNGTHGLVQEVTNEPHPQLVWQMQITNQNSYRANRIPSLYPGVQW